MKSLAWFLLPLCLVTIATARQNKRGGRCAQPVPSKPLVCYYEGRVPIDRSAYPCLCTHIVHTTAATISDNSTLQLDSGVSDWSARLKERNPSLQVLLSVGGVGSEGVVKSPEKRSRFVASVGQVVRQAGLQGLELNLDLAPNAGPHGKERLVDLLKALRSELGGNANSRPKRDHRMEDKQDDKETTQQPIRESFTSTSRQFRRTDGTTSRKNRLEDELTTNSDGSLLLRVPTEPEILVKRYDLKNISKYVDFLTVPTHNLSDATERGLTYHPSRLMGLADILNTDSMLDLLTGLGAPHNMIIISIPASGTSFTLKDPEQNTPRSPSSSGPKRISQGKLCSLLSEGGWTMERDEDLTAPYAFRNNTWLAFEDNISAGIKGKYVLLRDLAGAAVFPVDDDDLEDSCAPFISNKTTEEGSGVKGKTQHLPWLVASLHDTFTHLARQSRQVVLENLQEQIKQSTLLTFSGDIQLSPYRITRIVDTLGAVHVVRKEARTQFECSRQGYFVHPLGCNRFYRCVKFNQYSADFTVFEYDCPAGLAFDERWEVCVWPGSLPRGSPCTGSSEIAPVPRARYSCPAVEGYYADPENCRWFFACLDHARDGATALTAYEFRCPFGLVFDERKLVCDWPWLVGGCGSGYGGGAYFGAVQLDSGAYYGASSAAGVGVGLAGSRGYNAAGFGDSARLQGAGRGGNLAIVGAGRGDSLATLNGPGYVTTGANIATIGVQPISGSGFGSGRVYTSGAGVGSGAASGAGRGRVQFGSGEGSAGTFSSGGFGNAGVAAGENFGNVGGASSSYDHDRNIPSFAALPDSYVSGGRIDNTGGVVLETNLVGVPEYDSRFGSVGFGRGADTIGVNRGGVGSAFSFSNIAGGDAEGIYNANAAVVNSAAVRNNYAANAANVAATRNAAANDAATRNAYAVNAANAANAAAARNAAANDAATRNAYAVNAANAANVAATRNAAANDAATRNAYAVNAANAANVAAARNAAANDAATRNAYAVNAANAANAAAARNAAANDAATRNAYAVNAANAANAAATRNAAANDAATRNAYAVNAANAANVAAARNAAANDAATRNAYAVNAANAANVAAARNAAANDAATRNAYAVNAANTANAAAARNAAANEAVSRNAYAVNAANAANAAAARNAAANDAATRNAYAVNAANAANDAATRNAYAANAVNAANAAAVRNAVANEAASRNAYAVNAANAANEAASRNAYAVNSANAATANAAAANEAASRNAYAVNAANAATAAAARNAAANEAVSRNAYAISSANAAAARNAEANEAATRNAYAVNSANAAAARNAAANDAASRNAYAINVANAANEAAANEAASRNAYAVNSANAAAANEAASRNAYAANAANTANAAAARNAAANEAASRNAYAVNAANAANAAAVSNAAGITSDSFSFVSNTGTQRGYTSGNQGGSGLAFVPAESPRSAVVNTFNSPSTSFRRPQVNFVQPQAQLVPNVAIDTSNTQFVQSTPTPFYSISSTQRPLYSISSTPRPFYSVSSTPKPQGSGVFLDIPSVPLVEKVSFYQSTPQTSYRRPQAQFVKTVVETPSVPVIQQGPDISFVSTTPRPVQRRPVIQQNQFVQPIPVSVDTPVITYQSTPRPVYGSPLVAKTQLLEGVFGARGVPLVQQSPVTTFVQTGPQTTFRETKKEFVQPLVQVTSAPVVQPFVVDTARVSYKRPVVPQLQYEPNIVRTPLVQEAVSVDQPQVFDNAEVSFIQSTPRPSYRRPIVTQTQTPLFQQVFGGAPQQTSFQTSYRNKIVKAFPSVQTIVQTPQIPVVQNVPVATYNAQDISRTVTSVPVTTYRRPVTRLRPTVQSLPLTPTADSFQGTDKAGTFDYSYDQPAVIRARPQGFRYESGAGYVSSTTRPTDFVTVSTPRTPAFISGGSQGYSSSSGAVFSTPVSLQEAEVPFVGYEGDFGAKTAFFRDGLAPSYQQDNLSSNQSSYRFGQGVNLRQRHRTPIEGGERGVVFTQGEGYQFNQRLVPLAPAISAPQSVTYTTRGSYSGGRRRPVDVSNGQVYPTTFRPTVVSTYSTTAPEVFLPSLSTPIFRSSTVAPISFVSSTPKTVTYPQDYVISAPKAVSRFSPSVTSSYSQTRPSRVRVASQSTTTDTYVNSSPGYSSIQGQLRKGNANKNRISGERTGTLDENVDVLLNKYSGNFGGILNNNNNEGFISDVIEGDLARKQGGRAGSRGRLELSTLAPNIDSTTSLGRGRVGGFTSKTQGSRLSTASRGNGGYGDNLSSDISTDDDKTELGTATIYDEDGGVQFEAVKIGYGKTKGSREPIVVVTRLSDVNPILVAKLGAQCTCTKSNLVQLKRPVSGRGPTYRGYSSSPDYDIIDGVSSTTSLPILTSTYSPREYVSPTTLSGRPYNVPRRNGFRSNVSPGVTLVTQAPTLSSVLLSGYPSSTTPRIIGIKSREQLVNPVVSIAPQPSSVFLTGAPTVVSQPSVLVDTTSRRVPINSGRPSGYPRGRPDVDGSSNYRPGAGYDSGPRDELSGSPSSDDSVRTGGEPILGGASGPGLRGSSKSGLRGGSGSGLGDASRSGAAAGASFDRYGPGGLRGIDETLQGSVDCQRPGLFRHPKYCNKFYACHWDEWKSRYTLHVFNCPVQLAYDSSLGACNWPSQGPACSDDNLLV